MKKVTMLFSAAAITILLAINTPVVAQTTDNTATTTRTDDATDDDDTGKWGLAGLLGLLGLLGLRRRDDDKRTSTTVRRD